MGVLKGCWKKEVIILEVSSNNLKICFISGFRYDEQAYVKE